MTDVEPRVRLTGLDAARALAMIGMLIAHFVESGTGEGFASDVRDFMDGRAMPLFMLLGGVGISFLTARSAQPDRDLLTRAAILLPAGLALQEVTTDIAIILQYYAVFFVAAIALRRLGDSGLLIAAAGVMAIGAATKQTLAPTLPSYSGWQGLATFVDPGLWWAIVLNGYYPFFPAGAFLLVGMWLGRRRLDAPRMASNLVLVGLVLALMGSWVGAWIGDQVGASGVLIDATGQASLEASLLERYAESEALTLEEAAARIQADFPPTDEGRSGLEELANRLESDRPGFRWQRLFDAEGHSQMPAWVIGTIGSSLAVIGVALATTKRRSLTGLVVLGQASLTFYVAQAVVINWTPPRSTTSIGQEYLLCLGLTLAFLAFAFTWRIWFERGPFESLLRVGGAPRTGGQL